jgi:hypothetical protein
MKMHGVVQSKGRRVWRACALSIALYASTLASQASAGAVIYNNTDPSKATVALGVNDAGHLNFWGGALPVNASAMGLAYRFPDGTFRDSTAPGCLCEGWGVAVTRSDGGRVSGFANEANGSGGLTGGEFSSSTTRATSQIGLSGAPVVVTHAYGVSLAPNLFQGNITITNTGTTAISDLVYRRAMDWDVPNTEFSEYVTHGGVAANLESKGGAVRFASDNGFASSNPLVDAGYLSGATVNVDFVKNGAADHGSVFDFAFGDLAAGESRSFNIYYGAADNLANAKKALDTIHADVYSLGQSSGPGGANDDEPTFIFAFGGVGTVERGTSPDNPLLPIVDVGTGVYEFPAPVSRRWYDPPFASGFAYSLVGGGAFTEVGITDGFGDLTIRLADGTLLSIGAGKTLSFEGMGLAPTSFEILGLSIDTGAPGYDPMRAFPTFLSFSGSPDSLLMRPLLDTSEVPVPGSLLLVLTGMGLLARSRRNRQPEMA